MKFKGMNVLTDDELGAFVKASRSRAQRLSAEVARQKARAEMWKARALSRTRFQR